MVGHSLTWERSRALSNWVEEKLDRALAHEEWFRLFPSTHVLNEDTMTSDHSAIILYPDLSR